MEPGFHIAQHQSVKSQVEDIEIQKFSWTVVLPQFPFPLSSTSQ